jgi:hypothetical protein
MVSSRARTQRREGMAARVPAWTSERVVTMVGEEMEGGTGGEGAGGEAAMASREGASRREAATSRKRALASSQGEDADSEGSVCATLRKAAEASSRSDSGILDAPPPPPLSSSAAPALLPSTDSAELARASSCPRSCERVRDDTFSSEVRREWAAAADACRADGSREKEGAAGGGEAGEAWGEGWGATLTGAGWAGGEAESGTGEAGAERLSEEYESRPWSSSRSRSRSRERVGEVGPPPPPLAWLMSIGSMVGGVPGVVGGALGDRGTASAAVSTLRDGLLRFMGRPGMPGRGVELPRLKRLFGLKLDGDLKGLAIGGLEGGLGGGGRAGVRGGGGGGGEERGFGW